MAYDYDLFVIGGGSGGVRAARFTGPLGFKVGLAEEYRMGGTCVIRGCVPKKLLSYASHGFEDVADLAGYGFDARVDGLRMVPDGSYGNNPQSVIVEFLRVKLDLGGNDDHLRLVAQIRIQAECTLAAGHDQPYIAFVEIIRLAGVDDRLG